MPSSLKHMRRIWVAGSDWGRRFCIFASARHRNQRTCPKLPGVKIASGFSVAAVAPELMDAWCACALMDRPRISRVPSSQFRIQPFAYCSDSYILSKIKDPALRPKSLDEDFTGHLYLRCRHRQLIRFDMIRRDINGRILKCR